MLNDLFVCGGLIILVCFVLVMVLPFLFLLFEFLVFLVNSYWDYMDKLFDRIFGYENDKD